MSKPRVFITRIIPEEGLKAVMDSCEAEIWPYEFSPPREMLLEKVRRVKGILCLLTDKIDGPIMDAAGPGLKIISNYAVGFDNIDVQSATDRGVLVGNTPGVLTETTACQSGGACSPSLKGLISQDVIINGKDYPLPIYRG